MALRHGRVGFQHVFRFALFRNIPAFDQRPVPVAIGQRLQLNDYGYGAGLGAALDLAPVGAGASHAFFRTFAVEPGNARYQRFIGILDRGEPMEKLGVLEFDRPSLRIDDRNPDG